MIYLDLPNISTGGTVETQLSEIRSYIFKSNEQMNATLANMTTERIWENTANAISSAANNEETPQYLSQYAKIRNLIIKTAEEIAKTDEHYGMLLSGSYLAKGQFGEYLQNTSVEVDGNSTGFTELYRYASELGSDFGDYKLDESMYIRRGLLDNLAVPPVYGIELGILEKTLSVDGEVINLTEAYRTRITPDKWSFIYNGSDNQDSEVAYIQADKIYFPIANIQGGSININNKFKVNSSGDVEIATNSVNSPKFKLDSSDPSILFADSNDEKNFSVTSNGIQFYKRADSDKMMCSINRLNKIGTLHWGLELKVNSSYFSFFTIDDTRANHVPFAYIPSDYTPQQGDNNYFNGSPGFHINEPIDFHNKTISNAKVISMNVSGTMDVPGKANVTGELNVTNKMNVSGTLKSDGQIGMTEDVTVMTSGGTMTLHIRNGIITTS